jgi:hypothetical protein
LIKTIDPHLTDLEPLSNIEEMEAEAARMDNCLKKLVWQAAAGYRIYLRLRHGPAVTVELRKTAAGWVPGDIKGARNQAIDEPLAKRVRRELVSLANHLPTAASCKANDCAPDFLDDLRNFARAKFPAAEIDRLGQALLKIRGRTRAWAQGAYTIFSIKTVGYIQFMSSTDGNEYLCEFASHKYRSDRVRFLTAPAVDVIEGSGFLWPTGKENFLRWFRVTGPDDCRKLAELSLGLLAKIFSHEAEGLLKVQAVLPRTADAQTNAEACQEPEGRAARENRSRFVSYPCDIIFTKRPNQTKEAQPIRGR